MKINRTSVVALVGGGLAAASLAFAGPAAARGDGGHAAAPGPSHVAQASPSGQFGWHDPNVHGSAGVGNGGFTGRGGNGGLMSGGLGMRGGNGGI